MPSVAGYGRYLARGRHQKAGSCNPGGVFPRRLRKSSVIYFERHTPCGKLQKVLEPTPPAQIAPNTIHPAATIRRTPAISLFILPSIPRLKTLLAAFSPRFQLALRANNRGRFRGLARPRDARRIRYPQYSARFLFRLSRSNTVINPACFLSMRALTKSMMAMWCPGWLLARKPWLNK